MSTFSESESKVISGSTLISSFSFTGPEDLELSPLSFFGSSGFVSSALIEFGLLLLGVLSVSVESLFLSLGEKTTAIIIMQAMTKKASPKITKRGAADDGEDQGPECVHVVPESTASGVRGWMYLLSGRVLYL